MRQWFPLSTAVGTSVPLLKQLFLIPMAEGDTETQAGEGTGPSRTPCDTWSVLSLVTDLSPRPLSAWCPQGLAQCPASLHEC